MFMTQEKIDPPAPIPPRDENHPVTRANELVKKIREEDEAEKNEQPLPEIGNYDHKTE